MVTAANATSSLLLVQVSPPAPSSPHAIPAGTPACRSGTVCDGVMRRNASLPQIALRIKMEQQVKEAKNPSRRGEGQEKSLPNRPPLLPRTPEKGEVGRLLSPESPPKPNR